MSKESLQDFLIRVEFKALKGQGGEVE